MDIHVGLHSGRLQPSLQILEKGGSESQWQTIQPQLQPFKNLIVHAPDGSKQCKFFIVLIDYNYQSFMIHYKHISLLNDIVKMFYDI